jgi:hypothetical protein
MLKGRFFEAMTYDGEPLNLALLVTATYVESLDLSGPKLMLLFKDTDGSMTDLIGLKEHEGILEVAFSDPRQRGGTGFSEKFIIEKMKEDSRGGLVVSCLAESISKIKRVAEVTTIFAAGSPIKAIESIVGAKVEGSAFQAAPEFHLLAGMRPSKLLRNIGSEIGARVFYYRGTWYVVSIDDLFKAKPYKQLTHNKVGAYESISHVSYSGAQKVVGEVGRTRYSGWSMTEGMISSGTGRASPTGVDTEAELKTLGRLLVPQLEFQVMVNADSEMTPQKMVAIEWHRPNSPDAPMNESLPDRALVGTVSHHYDGIQFVQKVITLMESV